MYGVAAIYRRLAALFGGLRTGQFRDPMMAEALLPVLPVHQQLHGLADLSRLKLGQQLLTRSDPHPEKKGPQSWHLDNAYLPRHREATSDYPRGRMHYHIIVALNDVGSGGAAFCVVPGSHRVNMRHISELSAEDCESYERGKSYGVKYGQQSTLREELLMQYHAGSGRGGGGDPTTYASARESMVGGVEVLIDEDAAAIIKMRHSALMCNDKSADDWMK